MSPLRAYGLPRQAVVRSTKLGQRSFVSSLKPHANFPFQRGPAPPRLPDEDQKIFEELQRQSTGAFSTPRSEREPIATPSPINQSPGASRSEAAEAKSVIAERLAKLRGETSQGSGMEDKFSKNIDVKDDGETLHPNLRRGAAPEFEGDINPKTGEVGGPKNEPLRWGAAGEWTYNGRTTDF